MDIHNYPGRGLSLSQLIFALNEELKRVAYSPSYVAKGRLSVKELRADCLSRFALEAVSQLDRDASVALATIREWRNSFACVNRIPTDILTLIPTHLPTQKDRFRAASVCRHWRGVLLKHGALWSQLFLRRGDERVSTLLKRAKGSPLDIVTYYDVPDATMTLISPRAQQIRYLEFIGSNWKSVIIFSELNSGQLPLLRTLKITHPIIFDSHGQPNVVTSPSLPMFRGSISLEHFAFRSGEFSYLSHFIFPNLTTFVLVSHPEQECSASYLFDFLKASTMLQTVEVNLSAKVVLRGVPQAVVATLPNVKSFSLNVYDGPTTHIHDIAAHISCPCARHMSLVNGIDDTWMNPDLKIFPTHVLWNTIIRQHATNLIGAVTLEIKNPTDKDIESFLTFHSSNTTAVKLGFNVDDTGGDEAELSMPRAEMGWEIFSQALMTIRNYPLLSHVKRLHFEYRAAIPDTYEILPVVAEVRELFSSLGPLDVLTIRGCDLRVFLSDFHDDPVLDDLKGPVMFPHVKELTISHPAMGEDEIECRDAIVELAKFQHALGIPFERITVHMWNLPAGMADELGRWVDAVDCRENWY